MSVFTGKGMERNLKATGRAEIRSTVRAERRTQREGDESARRPVASQLPPPAPAPDGRTWMVLCVIRPDGVCVAVFPYPHRPAAELYATRVGGCVMPYKSAVPAPKSNPPAVPFVTVRPPAATVTIHTSAGFHMVHEYDNPADAYLAADRFATVQHDERGGLRTRSACGNVWTVCVKPVAAYTDATGRRFAERVAFTATVTVVLA